MTTAASTRTLADLIADLGVPPERILFPPALGSATESDLLYLNMRENRVVELVDGVLVEKAVGFEESLLAAALIEALRRYVIPRKLGVVAGSDGMVRLGESRRARRQAWRSLPGWDWQNPSITGIQVERDRDRSRARRITPFPGRAQV